MKLKRFAGTGMSSSVVSTEDLEAKLQTCYTKLLKSKKAKVPQQKMTELNEPIVGKAMQTKLRAHIITQKQRGVKQAIKDKVHRRKQSSMVVSHTAQLSPRKEGGGGFTQEANKVLPIIIAQPLSVKVESLKNIDVARVANLKKPLGQENVHSRNGRIGQLK